jgi:hypothetical protein
LFHLSLSWILSREFADDDAPCAHLPFVVTFASLAAREEYREIFKLDHEFSGWESFKLSFKGVHRRFYFVGLLAHPALD